MKIDIPKHEQGLIRVFAVNRAAADVSAAIKSTGKAALATDLLGIDVPEDGIDLFPVSDLSGVGLAGYLTEGYAVSADQLDPARSRLDSLDGYVLLVFSSAAEGQDKTLTPGPDLTLIGTYGEAQPDMTALAIESTSAAAYSGTPRQTPATLPRRSPGGSLVVVAIIIVVGLVCWWALS